jgi:uncharacterized membrane protein
MKYILCSVLLLYFFFTSGICYELASPNIINHIESPYNIGLSAERTGITDIATQDDIKALNWLKENAQGRKIVSDYNGYCLVHGFLQNHVNDLRYGNLTDIKSGDLVFLSSWNIRNHKYIEPNGVGTREGYDLPKFEEGYEIIYLGEAQTVYVTKSWGNFPQKIPNEIYFSGAVILEKE